MNLGQVRIQFQRLLEMSEGPIEFSFRCKRNAEVIVRFHELRLDLQFFVKFSDCFIEMSTIQKQRANVVVHAGPNLLRLKNLFEVDARLLVLSTC